MTAPVREARRTLELRGGNLELFSARDGEILAEGPAGTGKTRTNLELLNMLCHLYPRLSVLMVRKTQVSMAASCIKEFRQHVLDPADEVEFFGGSKSEPAAFRYKNGSSIAVGGMDDPEKILSSFYDLVYVNEASQLTEDEWETLTTRLRAGDPEADPKHAQTGESFRHRRILADCNPAPKSHWLSQRTDAGITRLITTRLQDNPAYYDKDGNPTAAGEDYISKLDRLTGTRYQRFRLGIRVGVENAIYEGFDPDIHVRELPTGIRFVDGVLGVDYGRRHKAACVAISVDQLGRRWVREAWAQADSENGLQTARQAGRLWQRYNLRRAGVDPNQDVLIGLMGSYRVKRASLAEGSRQSRIDIVAHAMQVFPGGRYVPLKDEFKARAHHGPFLEDDSPGLLFVKGAPGIEELCEEIEGYHYMHILTDRRDVMDVVRIQDDRIAAVEYGMWAQEYKQATQPEVFGRAQMGIPWLTQGVSEFRKR